MKNRKHIMKLTKDIFPKWASRLHEKVHDRDNVEHNMWIVAVPFCAMLHINYRGYFPGDKDPKCSISCPCGTALLSSKKDDLSMVPLIYRLTVCRVSLPCITFMLGRKCTATLVFPMFLAAKTMDS